MRSRWFVALFFLLLPLAFFTPAVDKATTLFFYQHKTFSKAPLYTFLYDYGTWPALLTGVLSLVSFSLSFFLVSFKQWRKASLFLLLVLLLGAGVITNSLFKDHWGRPRPRQVKEFGGTQQFRPFYLPNFFHQPEPSRSFPCGHASSGFYFLSFYFLGKRLHKKWLTHLGITIGLLMGTLIGWARIAQGGHFFSDVLFSAIVMGSTAAFLDWLLYE